MSLAPAVPNTTARLRQVAFVGPTGVGKSTAVSAVSDVPVVHAAVTTEPTVGRAAAHRRAPVGFDLGEWRGPGGDVIGVIGAQGQERYTAAAPAQSRTVLWVFGDRPYAVGEAEEWLRYVADPASLGSLTVAVTRSGSGGPSLAAFREMLDHYDPRIGLLAADPRDREDVERVMLVSLTA